MAGHEFQPRPRPRYRRRRLARPARLAASLVRHAEGRLGPRATTTIWRATSSTARVHGSAARPARPLRRPARVFRDQGPGRPAGGVRHLLVREGLRSSTASVLAQADAWRQRTGGRVLRGHQPGASPRRLSARPCSASARISTRSSIRRRWASASPSACSSPMPRRAWASRSPQSILFVDDKASQRRRRPRWPAGAPCSIAGRRAWRGSWRPWTQGYGE